MTTLLSRASFFFFTLAILGLYLADYAKAVPSIAMIGLVLCALIYRFGLHEKIRIPKDMIILSAGMMILYAIQFATSKNFDYLSERIQIKLPIMLLPPAIMMLPPFSKNNLTRLALVFVTITAVTALFITIRFLFNYEYYLTLIRQSQVVPGPINHIRFSLMTVTATYFCYFFTIEQNCFSTKALRRIFLGIMVFLIFFIHLYAVRSGILALYCVIFYLLLVYLKKYGNLKIWLLSMLGFILIPILAYSLSSSIQNKVKASLHDWESYRQGKNNEYNSLGKRMVSYQIAFETFLAQPITGCGIGDLEDINRAAFQQSHPEVNTIIIPHNQFIYFFMGSGLIGTLLFTWSFFYPLFYRKNYLSGLMSIHFLLLFISFQTEPMLETQLGVAYSILFILFARQWIRTEHAEVA